MQLVKNMAFALVILLSVPLGTAADPGASKILKKIYAKFEIERDGKPLGIIKAELFVDKVPKTVQNFVGLAEGTTPFIEYDTSKGKEGAETTRAFYNGLTFHRLVKGFVIQGGCPLGNGKGGSGKKVPDEFSPELTHNAEGILAMANSGPGTTSSQFYFTLRPAKELDSNRPRRGFNIFGKVTEGLNVLKEMNNTPINPITSKPKVPLIMKSVTIERVYAD